MYSDKTLTLNNGIKISQIQLGTWLINNDDVKKVVRQAISIGYRAFDTARDYGNENGVGKGIWNSDVERSDIYLTTKLPTAVKDYEGTKKAINEALDRFSFLQEDIANIVNNGIIKPAVNQIEVHIGHVPTDFITLPAQLMLAFDLQLGCIVLPKSDNVSEMKENVDIDFEISEEDMANLIKLKENTQDMSV